MRVLVTGFEPFGGSAVNPSWEVARRLDGEDVGGATVVAALLPVVWGAVEAALARALEAHAPDAVVCLGQSSRSEITPERVGINVQCGVDSVGEDRLDRPVDPDGPDAYFSTLPLRAMVDAVRAAGVPASVSNTAGTYLCNTAAYLVRHLLARAGRSIPAGFVHVPSLPEQAAARDSTAGPLPSMALEVQVLGIRAALGAVRAALPSPPGLGVHRPA